jgi:hypothetical protein
VFRAARRLLNHSSSVNQELPMKRFRLAAFAFAALTSLPGLAMAAGPESASRAQCKEMRHDRRMKLDADGNGKVERGERRAMRKGHHQEALARYDADRDGTLSDTERARLRTDRQDTRFARLDVDRDGRISKAEADKACGRLARHFATIDADGDGRISRTELAAAHGGKRKNGKANWRKRHSSGG